MAQSALAEFEARVKSIPKNLSGPFHVEARNLESQLLMIFKVVVLCTKRTDDLDEVAKWWGIMVGLCDQWGSRLSEITKSHPESGAETYYDRVLDLRNKCHRLQKMHS
jgi:hypothetical protein